MIKHLNENTILSPHQHGFRKGKSVETQMLECINEWTLSLDKKDSVDVVYFDFSKAFDRVSHRMLLNKLEKLGFHSTIVSWIREYLRKRTFAVRVNSSFSSSREITSGVPQGSALSPILFNIFTFELPSILTESPVMRCKVFADDTKVFKSFSNGESNEELQKCLDKMYKLSVDSGLPLSVEKTSVLHLGAKNPSQTYEMNGIDLRKVDQNVRDLGFLLNQNLSFKDHVKHINKSAKHRTYNLFKVLKTRNKNVWLKAYKTYVRPMVAFGTTVFNSDSGFFLRNLNQFRTTSLESCFSV